LVWSLSNDLWRVLNWWGYIFIGLLTTSIVAIVVFFVLWPAMWVDPVGALNLTFGKLFVDQEAGAGNLGLFWFGRFVEDPGPAFYPIAFLLKSTPWLLIGLLLSFFYFFKNTPNPGPEAFNPKSKIHTVLRPAQGNPKSQTLSLWSFALIYLIIMTIASKKSIRYMMPAFPVFYLLAGLAYFHLLKTIKTQKPLSFLFRSSSPLLPISPAPLLLTLLCLILFTLFYHPYYFTYYNPLVLGWRWAPQTLLVGWGEGLDEAARYLNDQPKGEVSTWYEWLFSILYQGEVQPVVPQENLVTADHTVLYINQVQRDIPGPNIIDYFRSRRQPEYTVRLAGIDYAWVYPGPIAGFRPDPTPQYPLTGEFGGEVRLLGYDLHPLHPAGGDSLIVTLYWRVLMTPPTERFVYLRLVDDQGHIWAKTDSPPVTGLWPTTRWQPDMLIEDAQALPIPPGTPPGNYRLEVGLYNPTTDVPQILPASGQPVGQGGGLLLGQVTINWRSMQAEPDLPWLTNARLSSEIHLIGYSPPPAAATSGDLIPIRLAWREASSLLRFGRAAESEIVFKWYQDEHAQAEQRASFPLPVDEWGRRATLLSQHDIIVPPTLETGSYDLNVSLYNGAQPAGESVWLGTVEVTAPSHQFDLPSEAISPSHPAQLTAESTQKISLTGYNYEIADQGINLKLYWQPETPITTRYKVFAQLLTADNTLVAQSDSVPATGERPTTGWLPGEIITDPHRLNLISDLPQGNYHIIVGLYNPVDGQRVPMLNEAGETIADAIFVTEVTLP